MMNFIATVEVMIEAYQNCVDHWLREGVQEEEAKRLARKDIEGMTTNPFSPNGELLNEEARIGFIRALEII